MPKLSIIILSFNTKSYLEACLKSLDEKINNIDFETIIVDNASTDGSREFIRKNLKKVLVIENNQNFGFSKANNIGAKKAHGEYLLFLNSDTQILQADFRKAINFMADKNIGALGFQLKNIDGTNQPSVGNFYDLKNVFLMLLGFERLGFLRYSPRNQTEVDWVSGAALFMGKKTFERMKGFDEKIFMYMEDMELCFRIKKSGQKIYYSPDVSILHKGLGSSNRSFAINSIFRSLLYFYGKHKSAAEYSLVKRMLLAKGKMLIFIGRLVKNNYLVNTYTEAIKF